MKLYTINATPVRSYKQLEEFEKSAINGKRVTVAQINDRRVENYSSDVAEVLGDYGIDGFTMYKVTGYWQGEEETSFKIEVAHSHELDIRRACKLLRDAYKQDSVMLTLPDNTVEFI